MTITLDDNANSAQSQDPMSSPFSQYKKRSYLLMLSFQESYIQQIITAEGMVNESSVVSNEIRCRQPWCGKSVELIN
jgi:hypothetical protein